jgi:hypothetical protein
MRHLVATASSLALVGVEGTVSTSATTTVIRTRLACVTGSRGSIGGSSALGLGGSCLRLVNVNKVNRNGIEMKGTQYAETRKNHIPLPELPMRLIPAGPVGT